MYTRTLTADEEYRLTGSLSSEKIELLLEFEGLDEAIGGAEAHIREARAQFPAEDCLAIPISELKELARSTRGDTRSALQRIAEMLEELQGAIASDAGYGREELREAIKVLSGEE